MKKSERNRMEEVVLVDDQNNQIGVAPKDSVHTDHTPLHRGFSCFLFNAKNEILVTRRADTKKTFPGVWSNSVCGHPAAEESAPEACRRRLAEELGLAVESIRVVSDYRYRFSDRNGIVENEICPILVAYSDMDPQPAREEIQEWKWMRWSAFIEDLNANPDRYSPWCREEAVILQRTNPELL